MKFFKWLKEFFTENGWIVLIAFALSLFCVLAFNIQLNLQ